MGKMESIKKYLQGTYTQKDKQLLKKAGILEMKHYSQSEVVRMIKERDFHNCIPKRCEWCGKETLVIHDHHFPIPKAAGGKEVVKICPTCHFEYHLLISGNYEMKSDYLRGVENG